MTNAEIIPDPKEDPRDFAEWYIKIAAGLNPEESQDILEKFVRWLQKEN